MPVQLRRAKAFDSLNLTPLIDVVFFLLVFFLVATRFEEEDRNLPVSLPSATNALPMTVEPEEIVINVNQSGEYYANGTMMNLAGVEMYLSEAATNNPLQQSVTIRGDKRTEYQNVVNIMDLCSKLGLANYRISTGSEEGP